MPLPGVRGSGAPCQGQPGAGRRRQGLGSWARGGVGLAAETKGKAPRRSLPGGEGALPMASGAKEGWGLAPLCSGWGGTRALGPAEAGSCVRVNPEPSWLPETVLSPPPVLWFEWDLVAREEPRVLQVL